MNTFSIPLAALSLLCERSLYLALQAMATPPSKLHFSTVIHYFSTFVQQHPGYLYAHLLFIVLAGVLWPLQVGTLFIASYNFCWPED